MGTLVAITGAAGNLGTRLRSHLEALGEFDLNLIDIDSRSDPAVFVADLAVYDHAWISYLTNVSVLIHLAANADYLASWSGLRGPNVAAVINLYCAAEAAEVQRVVLASSVWAG